MRVFVKIKEGINTFDLPDGWSDIVELVDVDEKMIARVMHMDQMGCYSYGSVQDLVIHKINKEK